MRNETIQDINQNVTSLPALEERRLRLLDRIKVAREQIKSLKAIYDARGSGIEVMQRHNLSMAIKKVTGQYSRNLNRETTEMHAAKLNYEKEREHLKDLEEENKELTQRITDLKKRKALLQAEITRREEAISTNSNHELNERYIEIQAISSEIAKQLVETDEALKAARKVLGSGKASLEELENAEQWTSSEIWGGSGLVSRTTKLSKIDHAQSTFNRLSTQIKDLERELSDVNLTETAILTTISSANHMVEFWFDNILSSQNIASVLRSNQVQIRVLITQTTVLIEQLEKNEEDLKARMSVLDQEKADLVATCLSCQSEDGEGAACVIG